MTKLRLNELIAALSLVALGASGCGPTKVGQQAAALNGKISVTGQARDAHGAPLPGVTIHLVGPSAAVTTTDGQGNYAFHQLAPGSYNARPQLHGCAFVPERADLDELSKDAIQNFDGSGPDCGGAPVGRLTISGFVNDANGLPLAGVKVRLSDREHSVQKTDAVGKYAFTKLVPGSYDVRVERDDDCEFLPEVADIDHLTDDAVQLFSGSGPGCGGATTVNGGATDGPLIISGHLRDANGQPIVGGRIELSGSARAVRFSDFTGAYAFHVRPGTYTLQSSGECALTPTATSQTVHADTTQDFTATSSGCVAAAQTNVAATGSVFRLGRSSTQLGFTLV